MKSKNLKYVFTCVMTVAIALSFSACATSGSAPAASNNTTGTVSSTGSARSTGNTNSAGSASSKAPAAGDVVAQYTFTNTGTVELCELYLSPVGVDNWGPDQLQAQTIAVGAKFVLKNIPAGSYDAKVVGCGGAGESVIKVDIKN